MLAAGNQESARWVRPVTLRRAACRGVGLKLWPILLFGVYLAYYWFSHQDTPLYTGRKQLIDTSPAQEAALGLQSYEQILAESQVVRPAGRCRSRSRASPSR